MRRTAYFAYGLLCYLMFFGVFLYAIGFIGGFGVPTSLDSAPRRSMLSAAAINVLLLAVFAIQHSVMARRWFKDWWTQFVPRPLERSTYVLFTNVAMILIFACWEPMGVSIWKVESTGAIVLYALFAVGWAIVFYATCLVSHFDLFGLRQVWLFYRNKPYTPLPFRESSLYRYVRHPLYIGWFMVIWFTPKMTASHLLFAAITTLYILIAIQFEERDLVKSLPGYASYRRRVPMLLPSWKSNAVENEGDAAVVERVF